MPDISPTLPELMIQHLLTVFGEKDTARRSRAIATLYAEDCLCIDYKSEVRGRPALNEKIEALHAKFPDFVFTADGEADAHHDVARLHWRFGSPGKPAAITGLDIAFFENSQIRKLYVFLDKVART